MPPYQIILTDDHEMFRAGLKSLIDQESELQVVGQARDGEELLQRLHSTRCDCIVLDLSMPNMDGLEALKIVHRSYPLIKILVLTMQKDPHHYRCAMEGGANGYLLKDDAYEQLVQAIKSLMRDKLFVSPSMAKCFNDRVIRPLDETELPSLELLTKREVEILKLVGGGLASKNIAMKLNISVRTVETHRANITNKLGIKTTAGLVKYVMAKGLL